MQNDQWTQTLITDAVLAYSKEQKNKRWWNIIKWLMIFSIIIFVSQQYNSPQKQSMAKINELFLNRVLKASHEFNH